MTGELADYQGEFRYVFFAGRDYYESTLVFYGDNLGLPVVGGFGERGARGFSDGTYFQASVGVIEVIAGDDDGLQELLTGSTDSYVGPAGGFLLIEVPDVDELAASVERSGVRILQGLADWPWQFRDFRVEDPCGNVLRFFSRLPGWEQWHGEVDL